MDGDEFYINENCPAGVEMAARYGYPAVEIDVRYTLDSVSTAIWCGEMLLYLLVNAHYVAAN